MSPASLRLRALLNQVEKITPSAYSFLLMNLPFITPLVRRLFMSPPTEHQVGVIPYALVGTEVTYLIITSRGTGKWIFPKGVLGPGEEPRLMAAREAREEAGVTGEVGAEPLGSYRDWKSRDGGRIVIEVVLYAMRVEEQFREWDERGERYRHWVTFHDLRKLLPNPAIAELAGELDASLRAAHGATSSNPQ
jgi:8-oxo-dGTP pyrophosphatase MutT (NUDIX family)